MKFYKCVNPNCQDKIAYRNDKASKYNYRCIDCLGKLVITTINYNEYKIGSFIESYMFFANLLVSACIAFIVFYMSPSDFGGTIESTYLQLLITALLFVLIQFGSYARILGVLEKEYTEIENNLRPLKSFLLSLLGSSLFGVVVICT